MHRRRILCILYCAKLFGSDGLYGLGGGGGGRLQVRNVTLCRKREALLKSWAVLRVRRRFCLDLTYSCVNRYGIVSNMTHFKFFCILFFEYFDRIQIRVAG
jgi:hypothetical protein